MHSTEAILTHILISHIQWGINNTLGFFFPSKAKIWLNQMDPDVNINKWNRLALVQAKWCFIGKVFHSAAPDRCFLKYATAIFMLGKMGCLVLLGFTTTFQSSFSYLQLKSKIKQKIWVCFKMHWKILLEKQNLQNPLK